MLWTKYFVNFGHTARAFWSLPSKKKRLAASAYVIIAASAYVIIVASAYVIIAASAYVIIAASAYVTYKCSLNEHK